MRGIIFALMLLLVGCTEALQLEVTPERGVLNTLPHPPSPAPLSLTITDGGWFIEAENFCTTPEQYEVMARNNAEILRYLRDLRDLLAWYRAQTLVPPGS